VLTASRKAVIAWLAGCRLPALVLPEIANTDGNCTANPEFGTADALFYQYC
jgi:hypothetical protein